MIKGKIKVELNEFETELQSILGCHAERLGFIYYLDLLQETFSRAEKHLLSDSKKFKNDLINEDPEIIQSLIQSYESVLNPLLSTLYCSYFITIHSVLEEILIKFYSIVEIYHCNSTFPKKTTQGCFISFKDEENKLPYINAILSKYKILIIYTYIRNGLVHPKNSKNCFEFIELEQLIIDKKITHLQILENEKGFKFEITEIEFIINYANEIISFFENLISDSVKYRNLNSLNYSNKTNPAQ